MSHSPRDQRYAQLRSLLADREPLEVGHPALTSWLRLEDRPIQAAAILRVSERQRDSQRAREIQNYILRSLAAAALGEPVFRWMAGVGAQGQLAALRSNPGFTPEQGRRFARSVCRVAMGRMGENTVDEKYAMERRMGWLAEMGEQGLESAEMEALLGSITGEEGEGRRPTRTPRDAQAGAIEGLMAQGIALTPAQLARLWDTWERYSRWVGIVQSEEAAHFAGHAAASRELVLRILGVQGGPGVALAVLRREDFWREEPLFEAVAPLPYGSVQEELRRQVPPRYFRRWFRHFAQSLPEQALAIVEEEDVASRLEREDWLPLLQAEDGRTRLSAGLALSRWERHKKERPNVRRTLR